MSSIIIWTNKESNNDNLWAVSDSRYTHSNHQSIITNNGPKIFELPIVCTGPGKAGFFTEQYYYHRIGFAFAGSVTAALCIYTNIANFLSHLSSIDRIIPSIKDINDFIIMIAKKYTCPIKNPYVIEFATFGYCQYEGKNQVFYTIIDEKNCVNTTDKSEDCKNLPLLLGAHKEEILKNIYDFSTTNPQLSSRTPMKVLKSIIENNVYPDIGGAIQLGYNIGIDFTLSSVSCKNFENENDSLQFRNIDIMRENGFVGDCFININGICC